MSNILSVNGLNYSYHDKIVFSNLTFSIDEKSINCVIGSNNCGKTTLIKLLCGILQSNGCIKIDDNVLANTNKYYSLIGFPIIKKDLKAMSFKVFDLLSSLKYDGLTKNEIVNRVDYLMDFFDANDFKNKKLKELTNLEKVKLFIVSALIKSPRILLLDDIFDSLLYDELITIFMIIKKYLELTNTSIVFTTNNLENILFCDKVLFINKGVVELEGPPNLILEHDNVLTREGVYVPIMLDLSLKLKFYNLVDEVIMDVCGMVDKLWK